MGNTAGGLVPVAFATMCAGLPLPALPRIADGLNYFRVDDDDILRPRTGNKATHWAIPYSEEMRGWPEWGGQRNMIRWTGDGGVYRTAMGNTLNGSSPGTPYRGQVMRSTWVSILFANHIAGLREHVSSNEDYEVMFDYWDRARGWMPWIMNADLWDIPHLYPRYEHVPEHMLAATFTAPSPGVIRADTGPWPHDGRIDAECVFDVRYRPVGTETWIEVSDIASLPHDIAVPAGAYQVQLRQRHATRGAGPWSFFSNTNTGAVPLTREVTVG